MKKKMIVVLCGIVILILALVVWSNVDSPAVKQIAPDEAAGENVTETEQEKEEDGSKPAGASGESNQSDSTITGENSATGASSTSGSTSGSISGRNKSGSTGSSTAGASETSDSSENTGGNSNSSSSNSSSSNSSSSNSDSSNSSNSNPGSSSSDRPQPSHTHTWVEQTITVTHETIGHYETRVVKEAWDEPVYEAKELSICNVCGEDVTGHAAEHAKVHALAGEGGGHHSEWRDILTGTIHHEAETEQVWVEDTPAYTETVGTGIYKCSVCGATK